MARKTKDNRKEEDVLLRLKKKGILSDKRQELEGLRKHKGPVLSLEEIRDLLSVIPGNLSDDIIQDRE